MGRLCGLPRLRAGTLALVAGGTTAGASLGCPGQERVQAGSGRGGAAVFGAGLQVAGQQAEGLDAVPGGGGGDGPHIGGQAGGPLGAGAVEVLAADDRGAQGALGGVVVQRQLRQVPVAGQPVPFVVQGGDDLGGGGVQQAFPGVAGLQDAVRIDVGEGALPAALGALVCLGAGCGGG